MIFRRRRNGGNGGGTAVAERRSQLAEELAGRSTESLLAEIAELTEANRAGRDLDRERELLKLRHGLGMRLVDESEDARSHPAPDEEGLPQAGGLPDLSPAQLTPELLRAGIMRDGSVLVRGLIDRADAERFAEEIDRSFEERDRHDDGSTPAAGYYEELEPDERFSAPLSRPWIKQGGGVLATDSPMLTFEMLEMFERSGINRLAGEYLGERPAISAHKTTLRKADPSVGGAWHQDGAFMGEVRALNVWVALSRCGDLSPGLDIVPRRLDYLVSSGTEGTYLSYQVSQANAEEAAGDTPIVRPVFEPGDVLFFDELCLHQTASDPSMPNPRFAIESWFFGPSAFPEDYAPIAI